DDTIKDYVPCDTQDNIACVDDFHYMICDHGYWRASREVPEDTFCLNGIIVNGDAVPRSLITFLSNDSVYSQVIPSDGEIISTTPVGEETIVGIV
ncbi:hypothetical protein GGF37_006496, partial [Kickxella alabastrina]